MRSRILAVAVLAVLCGCSARTVPVSHPATVPPAPLQLLHDWDAARADAWERADPVALSALYVPGAAAGVEDVALLRRYRARGVRLQGIRMQVLSVRVVVARDAWVRLAVVERFAGAQARTSHGVSDLPAGRAVRRVIDLRRSATGWRVAAVSASPRAAPR